MTPLDPNAMTEFTLRGEPLRAMDWPTYDTPWGRARALSQHEAKLARDGHLDVTWAELCATQVELNIGDGMEPGEAFRAAVTKVEEFKAEQAERLQP